MEDLYYGYTSSSLPTSTEVINSQSWLDGLNCMCSIKTRSGVFCQLDITCRPDSAVKTVVVSVREGKFCNSPEPKLLYQSIPSFERTSVRYQKLEQFPMRKMGEIYTLQIIFSYFVFLFRQLVCDHNLQQILTNNGPKDVVSRTNVPFGFQKC